MKERKGIVTFRGRPLTLLGGEVKVGHKAPDFVVVDNDLADTRLSNWQGKVRIIATVPSLDTPVCDLETRKFNEQAGELGGGVVVLTISMDLPFAQKRWCGAAGARNVRTLSDYREGAAGMALGVLIKELRLLARAVFVVDRQDTVRHVQIVPEITQEPDYASALAVARELTKAQGAR